MLTKNGMFIKLSDHERKTAEKQFQKEYSQCKDQIIRTVEVKIIKKSWGYIGVDNNNTNYPVQKKISNLKARQKYILHLNDFERIVKYEKMK